MRLLIDLQGAQSESRYRGIGRYSLSLTKALTALFGYDERAELLLNMRLTESIGTLRDEFPQLPTDRFRPLEVAGPVREIVAANSARARVSEIVREAAIASIAPDATLITSLFEGFVDDAVTSIGCYPRRVPTAVVLYDLIPLLRPDEYLPGSDVRAWYERKIESLKRADVLLSISSHTRDEAIAALGLAPERVVNIGTGLASGFARKNLDPDARARLLQSYDIARAYVMYTGGVDPRKNLDRLIQAFALLAPPLRARFQLVIVGRGPQQELDRLAALGRRKGLADGDVVFAGYAPDADLVALYSCCELFVFPSLHEGFGLPALEAMACGAPTIGANASSIPEVIGLRDALFDPRRLDEIADKLTHGLTDAGFRRALVDSGRQRAALFTWEAAAAKTLDALREISGMHACAVVSKPDRRLKLAFVSPLPPCKTGIAAYAETLLDCLAQHYQIDLICVQSEPIDARLTTRYGLRSSEWFRKQWRSYDRVLYQFGNSPFHIETLELAVRIPGVAVMHDFFMSDLLRWLQDVAGQPGAFSEAIYESHGLAGVLKKGMCGTEEAVRQLPSNLPTIGLASRLLVHSRHAIDLAARWYGESIRTQFIEVPFPRPLRRLPARSEARARLGLTADGFVVCTFGMVAPTKKNCELLEAWRGAACARKPGSWLVFVGENHGGCYGAAMLDAIQRSGRREQVRITGFVDPAVYDDYLAAMDVAVQLRSCSRGETSAAAFDVLSAGRALIGNRHGSMAELSEDAAFLLPDECSVDEIGAAIDDLCSRPQAAVSLGEAAAQTLARGHSIASAGVAFADAIERSYAAPDHAVTHQLRSTLARSGSFREMAAPAQLALVHASVMSMARLHQRRVFLDVTSTAESERHTGIERCVRAVVLEWLRLQPLAGRVEPVRLDAQAGTYRYAADYGRGLLSTDEPFATDHVIEVWPGDIFVGLDFVADRIPAMEAWFKTQRNRGLAVYFVVYDLLPVRLPQYFIGSLPAVFETWLHCIARISDGLFCISNAVRDDLLDWLNHETPRRDRPLRVGAFPLGADVESTAASRGLPPDHATVMQALRCRPTFLMVGTVEPRKGHAQVLEAFGDLWSNGVDVGLLIVGRPGWLMGQFVAAVEAHPERGKRLFWVKEGSDEFVEQVYHNCAALIAASFGEGFGLPLIEAARHGLPIVARDIPVFREVAGDDALYFEDKDAAAIVDGIRDWLRRREQGAIPSPNAITWSTWTESASRLADLIGSPAEAVAWLPCLRLRPGARVAFDSHRVDWVGWDVPEQTHRWSRGDRVVIVFALQPEGNWRGELTLNMRTLSRQRVAVCLNGQPIGEWTKDTLDEAWTITMPREALRLDADNRLELLLPDACVPGPEDARRLALAVRSLEFR